MAAGKSSIDTPLMRQYREVKARYPDCVVMFRVGDFYELFLEDAVTVARALDITLTTRDKGKEDPVPMAGVPHHALKTYLGRLVEQGFKVAICDQVEDPKLAKGIVRREVTRVVTPGVLVDEDQLDARRGCYLAAMIPNDDWARVGFAYLDVSTGEFCAAELEGAALEDELSRTAPRELLVPATLTDAQRTLVGGPASALRALTDLPLDASTPAEDRALLNEALADPLVPELDGAASSALALAAAAACLRYARRTQPTGELPVNRLVEYRASEHLILDEATQLHLEIFTSLSAATGGGQGKGARARGTLIALLDETRTAMGGRLLRRWLAAPLVDVAGIRRRHDAVEWLVERAVLRTTTRAALDGVYDLERLCGRATLGLATPRDLGALRRSIERLPALAKDLADAASHAIDVPLLIAPPPLDDTAALCGDVASRIAAALIDEPPLSFAEGGIIRRGFSADLDELVDIADGGKESLLAIELRERERTGIGSLKVRYTRAFGYYIELTKSHMSRAPADYVRKQTLTNCERYTTTELTEFESKILHAEERSVALEMDLFARLRVEVGAAGERLQRLAEWVARLDAIAGLAEVAQANSYVRPDVDEGGRLEIEGGRHPVVERLAAPGGFVPNDVTLDPDDAQLLVVTGPNMAGKSTVMRQVGLIVLMAQAGSFVPARRARIGIVDRLFTRVGASDNLARGESTFMVEMRETAHILRYATRRSLLLLDEIGRGTSTYDGVSIAWAVAEQLHDRVGAKAMFATHYHELTALARTRPRARNVQVAVREQEGGVVFLHQLVEGGASRSYGIQVARLAGLPRGVIDRARAVLAALERGDDVFGRARTPTAAIDTRQIELFGPRMPVPSAAEEVASELRALDPDELTPRAALELIARLREKLIT